MSVTWAEKNWLCGQFNLRRWFSACFIAEPKHYFTGDEYTLDLKMANYLLKKKALNTVFAIAQQILNRTVITFSKDGRFNFVWKESGPLNTNVLFIDQPALRSSVEGYLTCGAGILQLVIFYFKQPFGEFFRLYKVRKRSMSALKWKHSCEGNCSVKI